MIKHVLLTLALLMTSLIMVSAAEEAQDPDEWRTPTFGAPKASEDEDEQKQTSEEIANEQFAKSMQEAFARLNMTCRYPKGDEGFVIPKPWKVQLVTLPLRTGQTASFFDLHLKDGQTASAALNRFFQKPETRPLWVIECRIAQMIAFADAVRNELTNDVFDQVFKPGVNLGLFMAQFSTHAHQAPISSYSQVGVLGYFANLSMYRLFTGGKGLHNGINVVLCGLNKEGQKIYMGMGTFFNNAPKTYEEIRGYLLHHLLHEPVYGMTAELMNLRNAQMLYNSPSALTLYLMQMNLRETHEKDPSSLFAEFDNHQKTDQAANAIIAVNRDAIQTARQQHQQQAA